MAFRTFWASMDTAPSHAPSPTDASPTGERLDSWKEIAAYLKRSVRTVHRWEKEEGLPVHRQLHKDLGSVFAYKRELDAWSSARSVHAGPREETDERASAKPYRMIVAAALVASVVLIGAIAILAPRRSSAARSGQDAHVAGLELISTFAGSHRWPSLSPDGRMVAFVSDAGGTPQVWIKNVATGDPVQITFGDFPAVRPRWSARGRPHHLLAQRRWHLVRAATRRGTSPDREGRLECRCVARWPTACLRKSRTDFHCRR